MLTRMTCCVPLLALSLVACDDTRTPTPTPTPDPQFDGTCRDLVAWSDPSDSPPDVIGAAADWCEASLPGDVFGRIPTQQYTAADLYDTDHVGRVLNCAMTPVVTDAGTSHRYPQVCAASVEAAASLLTLYLPDFHEPENATLIMESPETFVFSLPAMDDDVVVFRCADGYGLRPISVHDTQWSPTGWDQRGQLPAGMETADLLRVLHAAWFHGATYLIDAQEPYREGAWIIYPTCAGAYSPPPVGGDPEPSGDGLPVEEPANVHVNGGAIAYNVETGAVFSGGRAVAILDVPEP
jgi:hypothetical protein